MNNCCRKWTSQPLLFWGWGLGGKWLRCSYELQVPRVCVLYGSKLRYDHSSMRSTPWTPSAELQPVNNPPKYPPVMTTTTILPRVPKRCNHNYCVDSFRFPANTSINTVTSDHSWKQTFTSRSNRPTISRIEASEQCCREEALQTSWQMEGPGSLASTKLGAPRWLICRIKICHRLNDLHDFLCACSNF